MQPEIEVSVVVPVFNNLPGLRRLVEALARQEPGGPAAELLVVDNGADPVRHDAYAEVLRASVLPARLLALPAPRNSYAARNAAVRAARGRILAFTDSDCVPEPGWLLAGTAMLEGGHGLGTGPVRFFFRSDRPTLGEWLDARWHLDTRRAMARGRGMTANLFVRRAVFDAVGPFDPLARSGGDSRWVLRALEGGWTMGYAEGACVGHEARGYRKLLRKRLRIGAGMVATERGQGRPLAGVLFSALKLVLPPRALACKVLGAPEAQPPMPAPRPLAYAALWLACAATAAGRLAGVVRLKN